MSKRTPLYDASQKPFLYTHKKHTPAHPDPHNRLHPSTRCTPLRQETALKHSSSRFRKTLHRYSRTPPDIPNAHFTSLSKSATHTFPSPINHHKPVPTRPDQANASVSAPRRRHRRPMPQPPFIPPPRPPRSPTPPVIRRYRSRALRRANWCA